MTDRDLDAAVAEQVMGLEVCAADARHQPPYRRVHWSDDLSDYGTGYCQTCTKPCAKEYSTDIAAAWEVIDHIKAQGEQAQTAFMQALHAIDIDEMIPLRLMIFHLTPDRICRAALKAKERSST